MPRGGQAVHDTTSSSEPSTGAVDGFRRWVRRRVESDAEASDADESASERDSVEPVVSDAGASDADESASERDSAGSAVFDISAVFDEIFEEILANHGSSEDGEADGSGDSSDPEEDHPLAALGPGIEDRTRRPRSQAPDSAGGMTPPRISGSDVESVGSVYDTELVSGDEIEVPGGYHVGDTVYALFEHEFEHFVVQYGDPCKVLGPAPSGEPDGIHVAFTCPDCGGENPISVAVPMISATIPVPAQEIELPGGFHVGELVYSIHAGRGGSGRSPLFGTRGIITTRSLNYALDQAYTGRPILSIMFEGSGGFLLAPHEISYQKLAPWEVVLPGGFKMGDKVYSLIEDPRLESLMYVGAQGKVVGFSSGGADFPRRARGAPGFKGLMVRFTILPGFPTIVRNMTPEQISKTRLSERAVERKYLGGLKLEERVATLAPDLYRGIVQGPGPGGLIQLLTRTNGIVWETRARIRTRGQMIHVERALDIMDRLRDEDSHTLDKKDSNTIIEAMEGITSVVVDLRQSASERVCALCQDHIRGEAWRLPCGHLYHKRCPGGNTIAAWLARKLKCPLCRHTMLPKVG